MLHSFAELLVALAEDLPLEAGGAAFGVEITVTELDLEVPIEARIAGAGDLFASLPRGRFAVGFAVPHGRVRLQLRREEP